MPQKFTDKLYHYKAFTDKTYHHKIYPKALSRLASHHFFLPMKNNLPTNYTTTTDKTYHHKVKNTDKIPHHKTKKSLSAQLYQGITPCSDKFPHYNGFTDKIYHHKHFHKAHTIHRSPHHHWVNAPSDKFPHHNVPYIYYYMFII